MDKVSGSMLLSGGSVEELGGRMLGIDDGVGNLIMHVINRLVYY